MTTLDPATVAPLGPPPPFDPELAAGLATFRQQQPDRPTTLTPELIPVVRRIRAAAEPPPGDAELSCDGAFEVSHEQAPGPDGGEVPLVICRPTGSAAPVPAIYFIHGGGMVMGDYRTGLPTGALRWAAELGAAVVSVQYRLAPEHPHPAPVEDCYAGLAWTAEHTTELGIDPARLLVAGVSAGGGLAAAVSLLARDRGGPALRAQLLICPMLDDRNDSPSSRQLIGVDTWDRDSNRTGWGALLGDRAGGPDVPPYAAPARAVDLSGLPPAFIDVGSCETFRDEDVDYAVRIWRAGGEAELHVWPGGYHGFDNTAPDAEVSQAAQAARLHWLRRVLNGQ